MELRDIPRPVPTRRHGGPRERTELVVWHATAGASAESSLQWIERPDSTAGYHYVIERDGRVFASTPLHCVAWHAGVSAWPVPVAGLPPRGSVNPRSVGIAFANRNDGSEVITAAQRAAALDLAEALAWRYGGLRQVAAHVRHRDVSPGRKTDPVPAALDWDRFREALAARLATVK